MTMRGAIKKILDVHRKHSTDNNGQFDKDNYPEWKTHIGGKGNELLYLKKEINDFLQTEGQPKIATTISKGRQGTDPVTIPWVAFRPTGGAGWGAMTASSGIYGNFLFSQDGTFCRLVIGLSTTSYPDGELQDRVEAIRQLDSAKILEIKGKIGSRLEASDFEWETSSNDGGDWGIACPYSINYPHDDVPSLASIRKDIQHITELYLALAEELVSEEIEPVLDELRAKNSSTQTNQITIDGVSLSEVDIRMMLLHFGITNTPLRISGKTRNGNDAPKMPLDYKREYWEWLARNCSKFQIKADFFYWDDGANDQNTELNAVILCHRHVILEGPPGVGKTHFLKTLLESGKFNYHTMLTFHASTEYNDFIGGLKPVISTQKVVSPAGMGGMFRVRSKPVLELKAVKGHFLEALRQTNKGKVLIWIDELNRGNVAKIFGELIGLIGTDKPGSPTIRNADLPDDVLNLKTVKLDNLHIVGTINTADRSISHLDAAIRRRFKFVRMKPDYTLSQISDIMESGDGQCFKLINESLRKKIGSDGELGHSYLFELKENPGARELIWRYSILPNIADLLIREDSKDLLPEINKNIPFDIHYELRKHGTGFSSHIEISRKGQTPDGEEE
jgi:hypothetical protein